MIVTMAVQRDEVSMGKSSVNKMSTKMNNRMKVVMIVTMAVQRDEVSMGKSSVTKMATNMKNTMKVVMLVTMAIQGDSPYGDELCEQNGHQHEQPDEGGNACDDGLSKRWNIY